MHRRAWPTRAEVLVPIGGPDERGLAALTLATEVLGQIRRTKSEAQKPLRTPVAKLVVRVGHAEQAVIDEIRADVTSSGFVQQFIVEPAEALAVTVELGELEAPKDGEKK